ncbi:MAG: hypothetical protein LQ338_000488 [Usnochroma carphineum]|nr:MAG: hypothetical protein LQ338_000488 [Usnochroma carphineum]
MPKVLSYTPSWLTRPSPGFDLFASTRKTPAPAAGNGFKVPTNEEEYRGPWRTIAQRSTEVFVVVDDQIRWSDLSILKYDWESLHRREGERAEADASERQPYKVLEVPINGEIRQLSVSPNGQFLAIATSHTIHIAVLPSSSKFDENTNPSIKVTAFTLGPTIHVREMSPVASILWHPCGVHGSCLVTVTSEAAVRVWELNKSNRWSFNAPTLAIDLRKLENAASQEQNVSPRRLGSNRGFSADMIDLEIASACFGGTGAPDESAWSVMTLWTVTTEGDVYALCPLLPSKWQPTATQIPCLTAIANAQRELLSLDASTSDDTYTPLLDDQWTWLSEIDVQVPFLAVREDDITAQDAIYSRPDRPGPIPRLQGPFQLSDDSSEDYLDVSDIRVIAPKLDTEELMQGEDDESDQGLREDTDGLSSTVVCLLTTDGKVHQFLDLEGVEGQWLPAKAPKTPPPQPEAPELVPLEVLESLNPKSVTEDEWPTFSSDPFSRYSFFVTHSQSVFFFSLDPWIYRLEEEMQSGVTHGAQSRLSTIRQSSSTLRERILRFDQEHPGSYIPPIANSCLAFYDSDLGYFLLTSTENNTHPHAASLDLPKSVAIKRESLSDDPNDPTAYPEDGEPFTELVTRPAYEPCPVFWQNSSLPSIAHTLPPHRRRLLKEEIRFSGATLDLMLHANRLLAEETAAVQAAAADLINRCHYMMQEMAEQLKQARLAAAKAEALQDGGGDEEEVMEGKNANEKVVKRLERARERAEGFRGRMGRLRRRVTKLEARPLNEREREFERELRDLDRATDPQAAEDESVDGNGNGNGRGEVEPYWQRYEEVKHLGEELLDAAKLVGKDGNDGKEEGREDEYAVPTELRKRKVEHVMGLLERESALVDAVMARLERLIVGVSV